jgi:Putative ATP-binding cassette
MAGVARGRFRLARNELFGGHRHGGRRGRHPLLAWVLLLALGTLVYFGLATLFVQLADEGATAIEAAEVLGLALSAALFGLLVFDLHEAVSTLLLDSDLELLRRAPIPPMALLALKLVDALPRTSSLLLVLALPAVAAFSLSYPLPLWAWLALPVGLAALWVVPLGVGVAGAILLLRLVPARLAREALALFSTLTLTLLWIANSLLLPRLAEPDQPFTGQLREALTRGLPGDAFSPGHWLAAALAAASEHAPLAALRAVLPLLGTALAALMLAIVIANRHLELAQARSGGAGERGTRRRAAAGRGLGARGVIGATLARDARLFTRDWTVLGDVLTAAALWTLIPLVGAPLHPSSSATLARAMLLALTVGLGYEVAARSLPFERQGLAWVRLAPVGAGRWVAAKLTGAFLLALPIMLVAAVSLALAFHLSLRAWIETACLVLPALGLSIALGLWTGAAFGDPQWTNPRAMLSLSGRILASVLLIAQAGMWLGLSALAHGFDDRLPSAVVYLGPALLAAGLAAVPIRASAARLRSLEWSY